MKLDFVIPGFSKCGTTTLCALLSEHPGIFIPKVKEPNFFTWKYDKGWGWYEKLFSKANEHQLWGDGSTSYSAGAAAERACHKILQDFPEMRFIFIARDPVKRLESSFREFHHNGYKYGLETPDNVNDALRSLPNMIADSRYWSVINIYRDKIPDDRILVLFLEDLKQDPAGELKKCFAFLGIDDEVPIKGLERQLNAGSTKYRDTKTMRLLRRNRLAKRCLSLMGLEHQNQWGRLLGLRKPFSLPIEWTFEARAMVHKALGDEVKNFLTFYGKSEEFWNFDSWASDCQFDDRAAA